ncbi:MAG TPA: hypothetical protein VH183_03220, partial [Burkholderiaceae bacterium]|nr:hypothetical protein [Burkholderiaceae bacterium]
MLQTALSRDRRGSGQGVETPAPPHVGFWLLPVALLCASASATPATTVSPGFETELAAGRAVDAIVEFDHAAADREAQATRLRRQLVHEDPAIVAMRATRYATVKRAAEAAATGTDGQRVRDYAHLPLSVWHLTSPAALARLRAQPAVRAVFGIRTFFPVATPP